MSDKPPTNARHAWNTKLVTLTSRDCVQLVANTASALINTLGPELRSEGMPYSTQMLLEEVIKELQSRV